jgi:hypothetical protein
LDKEMHLAAGDVRPVVVNLDGSAMDTLRAEANACVCPVVLCLQASEEQPAAAAVTVRALMVWLRFAGDGGRVLEVAAQCIYTSTGQGACQVLSLADLE